MAKMKLDMDTLVVDSFATDEADGGRGTVVGHEATFRCGTTDQCTANSCGAGTCALSCDGVCNTYFCV
ncbi:MAG: hypothetical protein JWM27_4767 [Gemmatimonadetes bacterium]|nr:hypothetical protein [Gemmatimonadota bacterium]